LKHFLAVNWNVSFTKCERGLTCPVQFHVQLVDKDSLGETQKLNLDIARVIREDIPMQNTTTV
jgi:hypothetical protein